MDLHFPLRFDSGGFRAPAPMRAARYGMRGVTFVRVPRHATARHDFGRHFLARDRWMGALDADHVAR